MGREKLPSVLGKKTRKDSHVFTSGAVARVLGIAPTTVRKLVRKGRLRGHYIGADLRVFRRDLIDYMVQQGLPPSLLEGGKRLLLGMGLDPPLVQGLREKLHEEVWTTEFVQSVFEAGFAVGKLPPDLLVADLCLGKSDVLQMLCYLGRLAPNVPVILLHPEDGHVTGLPACCKHAVGKPASPEDVLAAICKMFSNTAHDSGVLS